MAKVEIITDDKETPSPVEGKLYITEDERIILGSADKDHRIINGFYLDNGKKITIGISLVAIVPSTWKIILSNE